MAKPVLPYVKRVQDALDKIGTVNGHKLADPTLPPDIDKRNNDAVNKFFDQHKAVREYLVLDIAKKHIEGKHETAKKVVLAQLGIDETKLTAGDTRTFQFDNVNLTYKVTNGRALLNKEQLLVVLMTGMKALGLDNLPLDKATKIVELATKSGKPPLTLTPATTAE